MDFSQTPPVIGAIDVGTNAARLKLAHLYPGGQLVPFYKQRAPVRPGEGVFTTGEMPPQVATRLVDTICRFMDVCRAHGARVRAVATSSLRNARNAREVQARIQAQAGVYLEVISGLEEAHLICLGVLHGKHAADRSLVVDVGGGSTEVILAAGDMPIGLWSLPIGTVRLTEVYRSARRMQPKRLARLRAATHSVVEAGLRILPGEGLPATAFGSSGSIKALAGYVGPRRSSQIKCALLGEAAEELAAMKMRRRRQFFPAARADIIVAAAVILEVLAKHLGLQVIDSVEAGLRDGILVSLQRDLMARAIPLAPEVLPDSA